MRPVKEAGPSEILCCWRTPKSTIMRSTRSHCNYLLLNLPLEDIQK